MKITFSITFHFNFIGIGFLTSLCWCLQRSHYIEIVKLGMNNNLRMSGSMCLMLKKSSDRRQQEALEGAFKVSTFFSVPLKYHKIMFYKSMCISAQNILHSSEKNFRRLISMEMVCYLLMSITESWRSMEYNVLETKSCKLFRLQTKIMMGKLRFAKLHILMIKISINFAVPVFDSL